jgi:transcriptional regulator GlxA family with amidase domain
VTVTVSPAAAAQAKQTAQSSSRWSSSSAQITFVVICRRSAHQELLNLRQSSVSSCARIAASTSNVVRIHSGAMLATISLLTHRRAATNAAPAESLRVAFPRVIR